MVLIWPAKKCRTTYSLSSFLQNKIIDEPLFNTLLFVSHLLAYKSQPEETEERIE